MEVAFLRFPKTTFGLSIDLLQPEAERVSLMSSEGQEVANNVEDFKNLQEAYKNLKKLIRTLVKSYDPITLASSSV